MGQYSSHFLRLARRAGTLAAVLVCTCAMSHAQTKPADVIITHARVYTVNAKQQWAEAVAIRQRRIVAVGAARDVERLRGPRTESIDGQGRPVLPGLFDSHIHFMG